MREEMLSFQSLHTSRDETLGADRNQLWNRLKEEWQVRFAGTRRFSKRYSRVLTGGVLAAPVGVLGGLASSALVGEGVASAACGGNDPSGQNVATTINGWHVNLAMQGSTQNCSPYMDFTLLSATDADGTGSGASFVGHVELRNPKGSTVCNSTDGTITPTNSGVYCYYSPHANVGTGNYKGIFWESNGSGGYRDDVEVLGSF